MGRAFTREPIPRQIDGDVAAAIEAIEHSRMTHMKWIDHLENCPECPHEIVAGPKEHHEACVTKYDNVLKVLRSV